MLQRIEQSKVMRWLIIFVLALAAAQAAQPVEAQTPTPTHTFKLFIYGDHNGNGTRQSASEGSVKGAVVWSTFLDIDCNNTDDGDVYGATDATGSMTLATTTTNRSICVRNLKFTNPEGEYCWSIATGDYRKFVTLQLPPGGGIITAIMGKVLNSQYPCM